MGLVIQIDIKNRTYYFYNDMINIKKSDSSLLKTDKKSYKDTGIYNIGYIIFKKIDDYENICSVNPLYLTIAHASEYIEEKGGDKYLVLTQQMKIKKYKNFKCSFKENIRCSVYNKLLRNQCII